MNCLDLLSPPLRAELAIRRAELNRLYALPDIWLASAILKLCREARLNHPDIAPWGDTYDSKLVWFLGPEISRRLGLRRSTAAECDPQLQALTAVELRVLAGSVLLNSSCHRSGSAWWLLTHDPCNGNPIAMAVDRITPPPLQNRDDPLSRRISEVQSIRGLPLTGRWHPGAMASSTHREYIHE